MSHEILGYAVARFTVKAGSTAHQKIDAGEVFGRIVLVPTGS